MTNKAGKRVREARHILEALGMPRAQQNDRSALCLLALASIAPKTCWQDARNPLLGITPIIEWIGSNYRKVYAPNTRETVRRQTMHQFVNAGIAIYNPDDQSRPVNSPRAVYQLECELLSVVKAYGTVEWQERLDSYLSGRPKLIDLYTKRRNLSLVPVRISEEEDISLSPGEHSELIGAIIEEFAPRFTPGSRLAYVGDTGNRSCYLDRNLLSRLGVPMDQHGKMPDVVLYCEVKEWVVLVEAVTSHGPVDGKRHQELAALFPNAEAGLVYVTAFPDRTTMARYLSEIDWETEVWVSDAPDHLIHFNGERFLGPY